MPCPVALDKQYQPSFAEFTPTEKSKWEEKHVIFLSKWIYGKHSRCIPFLMRAGS